MKLDEMKRSCETCHWWSQHESHGPSNFRPCRFPLPDSAKDYILETEESLYEKKGLPALMKLGGSGENCDCWHSRIERGGRYLYGLGVE